MMLLARVELQGSRGSGRLSRQKCVVMLGPQKDHVR